MLTSLLLLPVSTTDKIVVGPLRVTAISPTALRVEPEGPNGFEDRTTFMVAARPSTGLPMTQNSTSKGVELITEHYTILLWNDWNGAGTHFPAFSVSSPTGKLLFDSGFVGLKPNLLEWPAPGADAAS